MKGIISALVAALIALVAACTPSSAADSSLICRAQEVLPDGSVVLSTTPAFLTSAGFERGDLVSLSVNGSTFVMPVCVGRADVDELQYAIVVDERVLVQLRGGSFAEASLTLEGDEITLVMNAKGLLKYHHLIHELASKDRDATLVVAAAPESKPQEAPTVQEYVVVPEQSNVPQMDKPSVPDEPMTIQADRGDSAAVDALQKDDSPAADESTLKQSDRNDSVAVGSNQNDDSPSVDETSTIQAGRIDSIAVDVPQTSQNERVDDARSADMAESVPAIDIPIESSDERVEAKSTNDTAFVSPDVKLDVHDVVSSDIIIVDSDPTVDEGAAMKLYRVIKGDCLWKISRREYGRGSRWPRIYRANIDSIDDPDIIYVDQLLSIPPKEEHQSR